ncbi:hypothetical protein [Nonlabens marinus]|uniref:Uncharacterized protein n=1 Tax=Nonlabens marinus S1-08 TaxID=1454201 RepID=W8VX98_9FLAO|nr:hypothetical protein [Nonlabens marinus]BAO55552.1 hypothetical protein NMS_1543 [Nonlabens marinus S1-08]
MNNILFQEEQKFNQWWLYLIVIGTIAIIIACAIAAVQSMESQIEVIAVVASCILGIIFMSSIWIMKLKTSITEEKIHIHYYPFVKREWFWSDLKTAEVLDYGFVGGWGIRIWTGMGTVYNVRGSKGLHFKTGDKEYVIGTQKEEELRSSIAHLLK